MYFRAYPKSRDQNHRGSVGAVLPLLGIVAVVGLGAVGLDVAHNVTTRTAEQSATDSGALAAASYIVTNPTGAQDAMGSPPIGATQATDFAQDLNTEATGLNVTGQNLADGKKVSNTTPGCAVAAEAYPPSDATATSAPYPGNNGRCEVTSSMSIRNMFSSIFGRMNDTVPVYSVATAYNSVVGVNPNQLFPIAVSIDTTVGHNVGDQNNLPLYMAHIGSQETFTLEEPCANAAWTTFNVLKPGQTDASAATWINGALGPYVGTSTSGPVPAQFVGEPNSSGAQPGGIDLWGDLSNPTQFQAQLPLVVDLPVMAGDEPFRDIPAAGNAGSSTAPSGPQTHPLLGFVGFKITNAVYGNDPTTGQPELQYIQGTIVKTLVTGVPGVANPVILPAGAPVPPNLITGAQQTNAAYNQLLQLALQDLSPGIVMLGSTNLNRGPNNQPEGTGGNGPIPAANTDVVYGALKTPASAYESVAASPLKGTAVATTLGSPNGTSLAATQTEPDMDGINSDVVYSSVMAEPNTPFTIVAYFTDETGLGSISSLSAWNSAGTNNVTLSSPVTATTSPTPPALPVANHLGAGWVLPTGFKAQKYTYQVLISVPPLASPAVLQMDSVDTDHGGDHAITLFDIHFPPCPVN